LEGREARARRGLSQRGARVGTSFGVNPDCCGYEGEEGDGGERQARL